MSEFRGSFKIGNWVYMATWQSVEKWVQCPECFGKKFLTVILGDDSQVTINCSACAPGYNPPTGLVRKYEHVPISVFAKVTGVDIQEKDGLVVAEYRLGGYCGVNEEDLFSEEAPARVRAKEKGDEYFQRENARLAGKDKNYRTWSWHVHYYRAEIRRAKETIEKAEKQLAAALKHVKEEKTETSGRQGT